ncbi:helix-turn-helix domain-containing protein [Pseudorhodoplanes sp.]|uniref:helix-turn-helix domain-containing protein n=1 Tax=Pseudorhodoplanes sp. TaxID=1934341 RepID=UPI002B76C8F3|nr:helix-turn-helix domain-containing protein [Pseudorhodoplanes sp.]HWV55271.1 helix-turn-helix domain-containing protein [Pseudorhodoplanes sp.]
MGIKHPNPRLAKIHRNYSVEELAGLLKVHKNTVRSWVRDGLRPIDDQRPTLIRGDEVRRFLIERRANAKQSCGPGRIYCLPCRAPKVPAGNMAELRSEGANGSLCGICPDCNRLIYRRVNPARMDAVRGDLDISIARAATRIEETSRPNVICHFDTKATTDEKSPSQ